MQITYHLGQNQLDALLALTLYRSWIYFPKNTNFSTNEYQNNHASINGCIVVLVINKVNTFSRFCGRRTFDSSSDNFLEANSVISIYCSVLKRAMTLIFLLNFMRSNALECLITFRRRGKNFWSRAVWLIEVTDVVWLLSSLICKETGRS